MKKERIEYEFLKRLERLHIVQCKNKLNKLLRHGVDVKDIFPGRFVNIETVELIDENHRQVCLTSGMPGLFVKLISSKTGDFYFYFSKDSSRDCLLCDKPENLIVNDYFVEIFDNKAILEDLEGIKTVTADFCRVYNDEIKFAEIFSDEEDGEQQND